jgi:transcriptional regulator with XRE-family HTH domain
MPDYKNDPTALRLKRLRLAKGFKSGAEFARFLGVSKGRWNNFERGFPMPKEIIELLCKKKIPGLTSDWLYWGDAGGLTVELQRQLEELDGDHPKTPPALKARKRRR